MKKEIPYSFVLDELFDMDLTMKPMFGCQAFYKGEKLLFILRRKEDNTEDNGIWIATNSAEDRAELKKKLKSMRSLRLFGTPDTAWQNIPEESSDFEKEALLACEMIKKGDPRIGKIPAPKKKKSSSPDKKAAKKTAPGKSSSSKTAVVKRKLSGKKVR